MALKIIFMGTPEFAVPILEALNKSKHDIISVYTQPPQKKNRGQKLSISPVHKYSIKNNIFLRYPENLDTTDEYNYIKKNKPNVVVVVAYGKIIPPKLLNIKNIQFINIHASLLPRWRGAAPIQRAIINLDKETGISIMKIKEKLDSGPIMKMKKVKISSSTRSKELSDKLSKLGSKMILESLDLIENKKAYFTSQNENEATYAKKISKSETKINWNDEGKKIIAKINAFSPFPGSWFFYNGIRIKVIKAKEVMTKGKPGEIINENFTIGCSDNAIEILELQKEGKKRVTTKEYLKGNNLEIGKIIS